jgi:hypothetical protein
MHFRILLTLVLVLLAKPAHALVFINWTGATITNPVGSNTTVTGFTSGDIVVPYTITITSKGSTHEITRDSPLGNNFNPLNLNLPETRNVNTLMTVTIALGAGYRMVNPSFTLLDIDVSPGAGQPGNPPPTRDWEDLLTFSPLLSGVNMTAVNPLFTQVSGNVARGIAGNVPNDSTNANVNVTSTGAYSTLSYTYGPGPLDGLQSNQRHGISIITMDGVVPEPGTYAMMGLMVAMVGIRHVRRNGWRLRKSS